ncbi:MAG: phosphomannomutase/phosphoglucomutase [Ruminococcaceae bacterium]|nr:phosphomannomutase/phosphoglucomutase [Oscillospiraceae bacterium]
MDYNALKSGTDIRGVASPLGGKEVNLTDEAVYDISAAFVVWYVNKYQKSPSELIFAVGHDSRITGENIAERVKQAFINAGVTVLDCGLSSTPAMFMTTVDLKTDASVEITASHHPFDRNGLKFFTPEGGLDSSDLTEIVDLANNGEEIICNCAGVVVEVNYMSVYAARLRRMICEAVGKTETEKPLEGYKIVVDAGNGVGGFYAHEVLEKLGADIKGSRFLEPDGMFPNHIPNPENKEAMESICAAVRESGADLGLIFDTDVDRAGCVGSDGEEINRNRLIALSAYIAAGGRKGAVIVTDSVTSDGLKEFIEKELGGVHYRYRRGYKNVINKAIELTNEGKDCPLAIETSGHAALKENYFLDDGAYLVTKIVIELAKGTDINTLLKPLKMPVEEKEIRFNIKAEDFKTYGLNVIKELEEYASKVEGYKIADDNREGIRVSTENGWFLLRLSVHDPVMPMNFESNIAGGIEKDIDALREFFSKFSELDISALN